MTSDPISDILTRIRNAGLALHPSVSMPHSKIKESVASILKQEGYIADYKTSGAGAKTLVLDLKYKARKPVITGLRQISTPGLRRYVGSTDIPRVLGGLGVAIVSTSKGLMTGSSAKKQNLGGELICYVW